MINRIETLISLKTIQCIFRVFFFFFMKYKIGREFVSQNLINTINEILNES